MSRKPTRRLLQLYVGLVLYGVSSAVLVRAGLGLEPWGVLHQGLAEKTGLTIGVVSIIVGTLVYALAIGPLAQLFLRVFAVPAPDTDGTVVAAGSRESAIIPR